MGLEGCEFRVRFRVQGYLEGQGDFSSRSKTPITGIPQIHSLPWVPRVYWRVYLLCFPIVGAINSNPTTKPLT